jgi:hypothetical protein
LSPPFKTAFGGSNMLSSYVYVQCTSFLFILQHPFFAPSLLLIPHPQIENGGGGGDGCDDNGT